MSLEALSTEATFVVRVARDGHGRLRGVVERVKTGEKQRFADAASLGAVVEHMLAASPDGASGRSRRQSPVDESP